eukprot:403369104
MVSRRILNLNQDQTHKNSKLTQIIQKRKNPRQNQKSKKTQRKQEEEKVPYQSKRSSQQSQQNDFNRHVSQSHGNQQIFQEFTNQKTSQLNHESFLTSSLNNFTAHLNHIQNRDFVFDTQNHVRDWSGIQQLMDPISSLENLQQYIPSCSLGSQNHLPQQVQVHDHTKLQSSPDTVQILEIVQIEESNATNRDKTWINDTLTQVAQMVDDNDLDPLLDELCSEVALKQPDQEIHNKDDENNLRYYARNRMGTGWERTFKHGECQKKRQDKKSGQSKEQTTESYQQGFNAHEQTPQTYLEMNPFFNTNSLQQLPSRNTEDFQNLPNGEIHSIQVTKRVMVSTQGSEYGREMDSNDNSMSITQEKELQNSRNRNTMNATNWKNQQISSPLVIQNNTFNMVGCLEGDSNINPFHSEFHSKIINQYQGIPLERPQQHLINLPNQDQDHIQPNFEGLMYHYKVFDAIFQPKQEQANNSPRSQFWNSQLNNHNHIDLNLHPQLFGESSINLMSFEEFNQKEELTLDDLINQQFNRK